MQPRRRSTGSRHGDIIVDIAMRGSVQSHLVVLAVLALPTIAGGEPPTVPPSGAAAAPDRGLFIPVAPRVNPAAPRARPPARTTRAMDFAQRHYAQRVAVTIGINAYAGRPWRPLNAAVTDAQNMASLFRAMGFDRIESLEDEAATREAILDLLEHKLPSIVHKEDLVVVFFAGHGATVGGQGYIVPRDADGDLEQTAISVQRLKESALRMRFRHMLFLTDACFSGVMLRRAELGRADVDQANKLAYWEAATQGRAVQILTAGSADERVQESHGWGHFTRAVYDGLDGAADLNDDGVVTANELADYTGHRVLREANGRQHPQWGTMEGSGTALFLDMRRLPKPRQALPRIPVIPGLEAPLGRVHEYLEHREWAKAEELIRDLMVKHAGAELRLLLAEVYIEADTLGNARMIDAELRSAAEYAVTPALQQHMLDLRARLEKAQRERL
jgi:hypothetical protein